VVGNRSSRLGVRSTPRASESYDSLESFYLALDILKIFQKVAGWYPKVEEEP